MSNKPSDIKGARRSQPPTVHLDTAAKVRITSDVQELMERRGMKLAQLQKEVARLLRGGGGTSYGAIWNYTHYDPARNAPPTHARRSVYGAIAKALGVSPARLIDNEGEWTAAEEPIAEIEALLPQWEDQWAPGAKEELEEVAPFLVKTSSPPVRAFFLDTLRKLVAYNHPDGAGSAAVRELAVKLNIYVLFGPELYLGVRGGGFTRREVEHYWIAALNAVQLSIPPRSGAAQMDQWWNEYRREDEDAEA